jgi:hypothetical protein
MDIERWRQHVLEPLLEGHEPTADADTLGGLAMLSADTDRTQDYVFESARLPEVRGASRQLDDLNDHIAEMVGQAFHEECVVYAGGGSLLALVPGDEAQLKRLRGEIETLYPKKTDVATITVDWRMVTPKMVRLGYPDGRFGGLARWAGGWLRRRKEDKPPGPFFEAPPHAIRCRSCNTRPADPFASFPDWRLCKTCKNKRIYEGRLAWFRRFQDFLDHHSQLRDEKYYRGYDRFPPFPSLREEKESPPRWLPQDLSELGQASLARKGYVGLIHLDGDDFGDLFHHIPTGACYRQFSDDIMETAKYVVMAALATHLHPAQVRASEARQEIGEELAPGELVWIHPFEIITVGGDDIWLIVPGDCAIPIAAAISKAFTEAGLSRPDEDDPCTLSGGVVIADDHNPVRILQDLAKKLTLEAKRARHEAEEEAEAEVNAGYVDFHIFKSADMLDRKISTLRRKYPYTLSGLGEHGKDLRLMARPYPADVLYKLWQKLEALRGPKSPFPTSQMHRLAEALLLGRHQSTLFYEYQRARDTDDGYFERLDDALRAVQGDRVRDPTPWKDLEHDLYSHQTALWDIAELYEFVSREGKSQ